MKIIPGIFATDASIINEMKRIDVSPSAIEIMVPKFKNYSLIISDIDSRAANILKQEMLVLGGEVALPRKVADFYIGNIDCLLSASKKQLQILLERIKKQPYKLKELGKKIELFLDKIDKEPDMISLSNKTLSFNKTLVMGILNITDDSFYDGGKYVNIDNAVKRAVAIENEGADIIDVGAASSRPGSKPIDIDVEIKRMVEVLRQIKNSTKIPISVDTFRPIVARESLLAGAEIVNDITGLKDSDMINVIREFNCPAIIMHMRGMPDTMQIDVNYDDVMRDISKYFEERIKSVNYDKIILDPGIGFGKNLEHNLLILKRLNEFKIFGFPILVGSSRKSFIGNILKKEPIDRLFGTLSAVAISVLNGANIIRVHDVKESIDVIKIAEAIQNVDK